MLPRFEIPLSDILSSPIYRLTTQRHCRSIGALISIKLSGLCSKASHCAFGLRRAIQMALPGPTHLETLSLLPDAAQASSAAETPPNVREHHRTSGAVSHSAHRLVCVLPRREILAPSIGGNGTADDFAMVRRLELQTDLAALLAMWRRLIFGVSVSDFLRFTQL